MKIVKNPYGMLMGALLSLFLVFSFKPSANNPQALEEKEYMTLVATSDEKGMNLKVYISINGEKYTKEDLGAKDQKSEGNFDLNPLVKILNEYRRGGWEVVSNNLSVKNQALSDVTLYNYFLLERVSPDFKKN